MLKTRVLSALVLIPLALGALWLGGWAFTALVTAFLLVAAWEFGQLFSDQESDISVPLVLGYILLWVAYGHWELLTILEIGLPLVTLAGAAEQVMIYHRSEARVERWSLSVAGGLYLGVGGAHLLRLRGIDGGRWWTLSTLVIIWVADSAAYFAGRAWGRHKMAPKISPNKSWEGYGAGLICGGLIGLMAGLFLLNWAGTKRLGPWRGAALGVLLAALTPLGDLFISLMKRQVGVKDTSTLIPGHGGVLDRIDSLLWAGVLSWMLISLYVR